MQKNDGFTLIELSIVLVIIGLIIGGVMAGQTLVRQSQLNSIIADSQRYIQATNTFQQKYGALPGDFANATTGYWATGTTCNPNGYNSTGNLNSTCNGNGDGQINNGANAATGSYNNEWFLYWQHLQLASLIEGNYNGVPSSNSNTLAHSVGTSSPKSKVDGAGFAVQYVGIPTSGTTYYTNVSYGHVFIIGGNDTTHYLPVTPIMTATEAYNVDLKFDDGAPSTGNILTWQNGSAYNSACATNATPPAYNTNGTGYLCSLIFITGF